MAMATTLTVKSVVAQMQSQARVLQFKL